MAPNDRRHRWFDRLVIAAFMLAYVASGFFSGSGYDTARDVAEAFAIVHSHALPLHGPLFAGTLYLGPIWFYVLALPLALDGSWLSLSLFAASLGSLQFPLAYAAGRRLLDRRFGLLWIASLALPGWGSFELVGFGHVNVVRVCTMLVLYALVRLVQERRPVWLVLAGGALGLAVHAHPSTVAYIPVVAAAALFALRDPRTLVVWGAAALAVALLPFAPLVVEQASTRSSFLAQTGDVVESMAEIENTAHIPALLYAVLVRGPRLIADAFVDWAPGVPASFTGVIIAIELAAGAGFVLALKRYRTLALTALATTAVVVAIVAWMRPTTSYYMAYAMLPPLAGLIALGLYRLCILTSSTAPATLGALLAAMLVLHVATVGGIAHAISSGGVVMPAMTRLDIIGNDPAPPLAEPWLPAHAVDASGKLLCSEPRPIVLHGTYAYLENTYFGLDHRLHCEKRDITLLGASPPSAAHLVGIARPLWTALGWEPATFIGGVGITPATRVVHPDAGYAVPDGSIYPPYTRPQGATHTLTLEARLPAAEALAISMPYYIWLTAPALEVAANGEPQRPLAHDAITLVYACRRCAPDSTVTWRIDIGSAAPRWIDVVTIAPPALRR